LPASEDHNFAPIDTVLRQMTCFGGDWILRGSDC